MITPSKNFLLVVDDDPSDRAAIIQKAQAWSSDIGQNITILEVDQQEKVNRGKTLSSAVAWKLHQAGIRDNDRLAVVSAGSSNLHNYRVAQYRKSSDKIYSNGFIDVLDGLRDFLIGNQPIESITESKPIEPFVLLRSAWMKGIEPIQNQQAFTCDSLTQLLDDNDCLEVEREPDNYEHTEIATKAAIEIAGDRIARISKPGMFDDDENFTKEQEGIFFDFLDKAFAQKATV